MPIAVRHSGPRKRKNSTFSFMPFAIHMCSFCDEGLEGDTVMATIAGKTHSYHLVCWDIERDDQLERDDEAVSVR